MLSDFTIYEAPKPECPKKDDEIGYNGTNVFLCVRHYLSKQSGYKLFFNDYFNILELLIKCKEYKIWAVQTVRKDRMRNYSFKSET